MNKIFTFLIAVFVTSCLWAQSPEKMSYQAVIRDASDNFVTNTDIGMRISILKGSTNGTPVYLETQIPRTNANGLVSIEIGMGTTSDDFSTIDWANGSYFIKTEIDPAGGTDYSITGVSQLLSVPYALHAKTADTVTGDITETDPTVTTYSVGDFAQGGIVFWVDETRQHGLVCAKEDQSTGIRWYAGTYGNTWATGDGPFAGETNTIIIIAAYVAIGNDGNVYAARICNELQVTEGDKTYGDWYLPSKEELNLMYLNKVTIDATAEANGGVVFGSTNYWSSTEYTHYGAAWHQSFENGDQGTNFNETTHGVRAIRAF